MIEAGAVVLKQIAALDCLAFGDPDQIGASTSASTGWGINLDGTADWPLDIGNIGSLGDIRGPGEPDRMTATAMAKQIRKPPAGSSGYWGSVTKPPLRKALASCRRKGDFAFVSPANPI